MPPTRGIFQLEVYGRTAHAQQRHLGDDALQAALTLVDTLRESGDTRILSIQSGDQGIRIPGRCNLCIATGFDTLPALPDGVVAKPLDDGSVVPFPIDDMVGAWSDAVCSANEALVTELEQMDWGTLERPPVLHHIGSLNSNRDRIQGQVIYWVPPGTHTQAIAETIAQRLQDRLRGEGELEGEVKVIQDRRALHQVNQPEFLATAKRALQTIDIPPTVSQGYVTTDGGLLMEAGVQTLAFGPGHGVGHLYRDDECVPLAHIEACYNFYERFIREWCLRRS